MTEIKPYMCSCCNDIWSRENQKSIKLGKYELHLCPDCYHEYIISNNKVLEQIRAEIEGTLYVDSLIFDELIDFLNGKISADDVIEEFNRVTRQEVLQIIDNYTKGE